MFLCRMWRFILYWWWFIGFALIFMVGVATTVLPLPTGKAIFALPACPPNFLCLALANPALQRWRIPVTRLPHACFKLSTPPSIGLPACLQAGW
jgi:hypothetical protein